MRDKSVFTTFEAAKLCHVSPLSIINWVNAGRLPAFRTPGGHRRIRREDLVRFMRENGIPIPEELRDGSGRGRVLVVDDEPGIREVIAEHLSTRSNAYEVMAAADVTHGRLRHLGAERHAQGAHSKGPRGYRCHWERAVFPRQGSGAARARSAVPKQSTG